MVAKKQTRVAIHNARRMGARAADAILTINDLDVERETKWKGKLRETLEREGWDVLSLAIAVDRSRFDVVATCYRHGESPQARAKDAVRRKPVTRGGQPIEGPIPTGRTMQGKVRALRGGQS